LLKDGKRAPRAGELFYNKNLAKTFRLLGENGKAGFYSGSVAESLVKVTSDLGGHITLDDLKSHAEKGTQKTEAISLRFTGQSATKHGDSQGIDVWEHPPNGQGLVALMALGMLQILEKDGKIATFTPKDHNSTAHLHAVVETLRLAFSDGNWFIADPDVSRVPAKELISEQYLADRVKQFSADKKLSFPIHHGNPVSSPAHAKSDTVYFAVTDSEGNGCSFINSNYTGFGTGIVPAGCGFTLQNRGSNFMLQPADHPNVFAPSKRPYHTIIPAMLTNASDSSLHSVYGVMGGFMQPQGHVQVLLNITAFGMSPQEALDAPRLCIGAGHPDAGSVYDETVYLEEGISDETVKGLKDLGHSVEVVKGMGRGLFGRGQLIRAHVEDGKLVYSAGSDMRGDGGAFPA
jgi:gamma-glutamyltranspeptidase / glutathione hydrolase